MDKVLIDNKEYEVIDALEYITIPDCFVKRTNKIGSGNGEAKLYVGQVNNALNFFDSFNRKCILKKEDLISYMTDSEGEYLNPEQEYIHKNEMPLLFKKNLEYINNIDKNIIEFEIFRAEVKPPRVYINSESEAYDLIRQISLPNISYISILKLKKEDEIIYYFRPFVDYKNEKDELFTIEKIEKENISSKEKENIIKSRIGQGKYREKLLIECPYCPITLVSDERLLIASHIKPWNKSNNEEKIDPKNGFMFTPTYDKLFDRGFISFDNEGIMIVSPWISPMNQKKLNIYSGKKINLPLEGRKEYLCYHREFVFKK